MAFWNKERNYYELFKQITELNLVDFQRGVKPNERFRNASGSMISIFDRNEINPRRLKKIYDLFGNEIVLEYLEDIELKNKSNLRRSGFMLIEDHVKIYSEEEIKSIINKFFNKEEMDEKEKYILMGVLQKIAELIDVYQYSNLTKYSDYIKKEVSIGIFEDIVVRGEKYSNDERRQIANLSEKWGKDTYYKYKNLELMKKRLLELENNKHTERRINKINDILKMDINELIEGGDFIKKELEDIYLYYEMKNREEIINKVYNPQKNEEVIIDDISKVNGEFLIHFFGPYTKIFTYESYIQNLENKIKRPLTVEERESERKKYEAMSNNFIANKSVPMIAIGQLTEYYKYSVDVHNQLSCMVITAEDVFKMKGTRGNLALGFSKETLEPDQIATISNKNIHANKNIENIETINDFKDFSANYNELINKEKYEPNTEVVMYRNTDMTTLKPSYVLYLSYNDINSDHERANINIYKEQMKEAGLEVPFVIFDNYTINKNLEKEKNER